MYLFASQRLSHSPLALMKRSRAAIKRPGQLLTAIVQSAIPIAMALSVMAAGCGDEASEGMSPSCVDRVQNADEVGVDCGGSCPACEVGATCSDGVQNGDEAGVDCGGSCPVCESEATCSDGVQNGDEAGVDCGGSCPVCESEATCSDGVQNADEVGVDCGGSCPACQSEPTCSDGLRNGPETGVDCGGSCPACEVGATCSDGVQNGDEGGVDCGGSCPVCEVGATCSDGLRNGLETDVDCGGGGCPPCPEGSLCVVHSDCAAGVCAVDICDDDGDLEPDECESDADCGAGFCEAKVCEPPRASAIAAGERHACALVQRGQVRCWGDATHWQTGRPLPGSPLSSVSTLTAEGWVPLEGLTGIAAGTRHTCAFNARSVFCWGSYAYEGNSRPVGNSPEATEILMLSETETGVGEVWSPLSGVTAMALGERHTCALMRDGVRCWGENDSGQLGDEDRSAAYTPSDLVPLGSPVHGLTGGKNHTCALGSSGVMCWGDNTTGQVSGIPTVGALPPTLVFQEAAVSIGARAQTSCVATSGPNTIGQIGNGVAWCWGALPFAAEGAGAGPVKLVGFPGFATMTAGDQFLCMLTALGVECIGEPGTAMNLRSGELRTAVGAGGRLDTNDTISAIVAGQGFACSLAQVGEVRCWGENDAGQLGDGTTEGRAFARPWTP